MTIAAIDSARFRQVLGHHPTGVAAITSLDAQGQPLVMVVGTFTSVSLDPPLVGFLPDKRSASWAALRATGRFVANVLAADQAATCATLAGRGDKWAGVGWAPSPAGLPVIDGALASVECTIEAVHDAGDHDFVLGRVSHLDVHGDGAPLLFFKGQYGSFQGG